MATGEQQFSTKRFTQAAILVNLFQLEYLFGSSQSSLGSERNGCSAVFLLRVYFSEFNIGFLFTVNSCLPCNVDKFEAHVVKFVTKS